MDNEELYFVYSCFADANHQPIELRLNQSAFNDLADYIEETRCSCVEYSFWQNQNVLHFYCDFDFFNTMQRFINHQANTIVWQMKKISGLTEKAF